MSQRRLRVWVASLLAVWLIAGCGSGHRDPGVPTGAEPLTDLVCPAGERSGAFTSFEVAEASTLYVYNVTGQRLVYEGKLDPGSLLKLSWGGIRVEGDLPNSRSFNKPREDRQIASYDVGSRYRVYIASGVSEEAKKQTLEGSLATKPYEVQDKTINTVEGQKPLYEK